MHRSARCNGVGDPVRMLGTRLQRVSRAIYPVKPPARLPVPHDFAEKTKSMLSRLVQFCLAGKVAQQFSCNPRLPLLKFEQLLLRAVNVPLAIEAAEKTSVLEIQTAGKPHVDKVPPQRPFEVAPCQHLKNSRKRQTHRKRRSRLMSG